MSPQGETLQEHHLTGHYCGVLHEYISQMSDYGILASFDGNILQFSIIDSQGGSPIGQSCSVGNKPLKECCERNAKYMLHSVFDSALRNVRL